MKRMSVTERRRTAITYLKRISKRAMKMYLWADKANKNGAMCGTAGCAIGNLTRSKKIAAAGLHLEHLSGDNGLEPVYRHQYGWDAIQAFFGLTFSEAFSIFGCGSYGHKAKASSKAVAKRFESVLKQKEFDKPLAAG